VSLVETAKQISAARKERLVKEVELHLLDLCEDLLSELLYHFEA